MKNLIIDAADEKIFFSIISESQSYTTSYINNRENFDKFIILLFNFLKKNKTKFKEIKNIFVNQGPGKFSGIRNTIAIAKGLAFSNKINLYGFRSKDRERNKYEKILDLHKKGMLIKDLIKPHY
mgnify:CR=1|tara:strand:+ start:717 stop:1088 length:372 start_codon:yes stop_codon:yes gene_type:complete